MTIQNLDFLFRPKSVAVIVDTEYSGHYPQIVQGNLQAGDFAGPVMFISAKKRSGFKIGPRVRLEKMAVVPELAIICVRLDLVAEIIIQLGDLGTRAVIIAPSIRERLAPTEATATCKAILDAARPHCIRILGSGSGGLLVPSIGLNASVSPVAVLPGRIALITQSTAIASAIVDHATSKGIGFSTVVHLGESLDVDLADALDWFAADNETERILVQFDSVAGGRNFMSAARASGRSKPVVAIRSPDNHPMRLPFNQNDIYDAALSRAGWVQVGTLSEAFEAAQGMARLRPMQGEGLSILANGTGLGSIAADQLLRSGGQLATLEQDTLDKLAALLKVSRSLSNPLELPASISISEWAEVLALILADPGTNALMTVYSPSPYASGTEVAGEIGRAAQSASQNIFSCWVGGDSMHAAQQIAIDHGMLGHDSPEQAVTVFIGLVNYYRNRELLMQTPPSLPEGYSIDLRQARDAVAEALESGVRLMPSRLTRKLLEAFGIEAVEYRTAVSGSGAIEVANEIGYPVDLGLVLAQGVSFAAIKANLQSPADIHMAIRSLRQKARYLRPGARISGYRLRRGAPRSGIAPVRIGVVSDAVFGPVIFLGPSSASPGSAGRFVVGLPPLNLILARDMVRRSLLAEEMPAALRKELEDSASMALVRLSQLLSDIDEVANLEIDPLHIETSGVLALEASIQLETRSRRLGPQRFAISPYPKELENRLTWRGEKLLIRPIRPEDENMLGRLLESLSAEDSRMRFFVAVRGQSHSQLARFSQIDYDREMSLVALRQEKGPKQQALGEIRLVADADQKIADFAIVVSTAFKGQGLGGLLMQQMIDFARNRGIAMLRGETLPENRHMQHLAQKFGFVIKPGGDPGTINLELALAEFPETD